MVLIGLYYQGCVKGWATRISGAKIRGSNQRILRRKWAVNGYQYPSWAKTAIDTRSGPLPVWPKDIDLDGDVDFVLGADGTVYWYENTTPMDSREGGREFAWALTALFRGNVLSVSLTLPAGVSYELALYSATGAKIATLERGVSSGEELEKDYPLDVGAGVYYLVLVAGQSNRALKVLKR